MVQFRRHISLSHGVAVLFVIVLLVGIVSLTWSQVAAKPEQAGRQLPVRADPLRHDSAWRVIASARWRG